MDEARRVLARLDRIDALGRNPLPAAALLLELRALVTEAEAWARREGEAAHGAESTIAAVRCAVAGPSRDQPKSSRSPPAS